MFWEKVLFKGECRYRREDISRKLKKRLDLRKRRGSANLRYRAKRLDNRLGKKGWLPPPENLGGGYFILKTEMIFLFWGLSPGARVAN
jgi:hypothetical protein